MQRNSPLPSSYLPPSYNSSDDTALPPAAQTAAGNAARVGLSAITRNLFMILPQNSHQYREESDFKPGEETPSTSSGSLSPSTPVSLSTPSSPQTPDLLDEPLESQLQVLNLCPVDTTSSLSSSVSASTASPLPAPSVAALALLPAASGVLPVNPLDDLLSVSASTASLFQSSLASPSLAASGALPTDPLISSSSASNDESSSQNRALDELLVQLMKQLDVCLQDTTSSLSSSVSASAASFLSTDLALPPPAASGALPANPLADNIRYSGVSCDDPSTASLLPPDLVLPPPAASGVLGLRKRKLDPDDENEQSPSLRPPLFKRAKTLGYEEPKARKKEGKEND